jgi:hypothetical protein
MNEIPEVKPAEDERITIVARVKPATYNYLHEKKTTKQSWGEFFDSIYTKEFL